jgi:hypothetical protein
LARGHLERAMADLERARLAWGGGPMASASWPSGAPGSVSRRASACWMTRDMRGPWSWVSRLTRLQMPPGAALAVAGAEVAGEPAICPCLAVKTRIGSPHP